MITALKRLLIANWQRKIVSLILSVIIWIVVNHSMTVTKPISGVSVRVLNIPQGKTIEGMLDNGTLANKIHLSITGNHAKIEKLTHNNLEVTIDAEGQPNEWIANISKKNLACTDTEIDLNKAVLHVSAPELIIKQSKLISEKVPVLITHPIGEPPKGYQFLDVWPYQLSLSVNGPEEAVKKLKSRGLKLTFNLNDITKEELDSLQASHKGALDDEVSYFVPNAWKKILISTLSETSFEIDDPQAKALRIDFSRQDLLPIGCPLPITVFFPPKFSASLNPETHFVMNNEFIVKRNGIQFISLPLYAEGVSHLFLETVKDMLQLVIIATPKTEKEELLWSTQFMYPHELEDRYVAKVLSESNHDVSDIQPALREDFLRNRFRGYMNRFRLYTPDHKKLSLKIELQAGGIFVTPQNYQ